VARLRCRLAPDLLLRAIYSCTARHAHLRDLGLRPEIKSRSGQSKVRSSDRYSGGFVGGGLLSLPLHLLSLFLVRPLHILEGAEGDRVVTFAPLSPRRGGRSRSIGGLVARGALSGIQGPRLITCSTGLGCKALFRLGLRWSEGTRGQSDFTTCFGNQCGRVGTMIGPASGAPQPMPRIGGFLILRPRAAVLWAKVPDFLRILPRTSPYV
jgi:hypothetical protein